MGKLYYFHGTMASAKSATLLMKAHQFNSTGVQCLLVKPAFDNRTVGSISSRVGLEEKCLLINKEDNLRQVLGNHCRLFGFNMVFVDEVQFLTDEQIKQLWEISRDITVGIDVFAFGLKTDYMNKLFSASAQLLVYADKIEEIKSKCRYCKNKATTHFRIVDGKIIKDGDNFIVGDNVGSERYVSVCQDCFNDPPKKL